MKYCLCFLFVIVSIACNRNVDKKNVIARIDGEEIYSDELNEVIQQELFDELNRIYKIKSEALRQLANNKLIILEARKNKLSKDDYLKKYVGNKVLQFGKDSLYRKYNIPSYLTSFHSKELYYVPDTTLEGSMLKEMALKSCLHSDLIDSLRNVYQIETYIYPPKSPNVKLNGVFPYYRGDTTSKVSVFIISDFDCENCIAAHDLYDSIYEEYKDRVKFGYINFSAVPTLSQIACDAANEQNCFWAYHDSLYTHNGIIDSAVVYNIAKNLRLDLKQFTNDLQSEERKEKIAKTINRLVMMGIYATPTVMVNGRLIVNSNSKNEITHLINEELKK